MNFEAIQSYKTLQGCLLKQIEHKCYFSQIILRSNSSVVAIHDQCLEVVILVTFHFFTAAPFIPSQQFLSIYVKQFTLILSNLRKVFTKNDFDCFAQHIIATVSVPLVVDSSVIFMLASNPENNGMSPVQTTVINTLHSTSKLILENNTSGNANTRSLSKTLHLTI